MLSVKRLTVRYGRRTAVSDVSFLLEAGQWLMLAGPNGAGKSTLVESVAQGRAYTGKIELDGRDIRAYSPAQLARRVGVLAQRNAVGYAYTVEEIVRLGRYAHETGLLSGGDREGQAKVDEALARTGLSQLRRRSVLTLSGGELQRVFLAQVFAQDPQLLILDEPANHLDLVYQQRVFSMIESWLAQPGRAVLSVVHDLSLARRYGTHAVLMHEGRCVAAGRAGDVLCAPNLERAYGMDVCAFMRELLEQWSQSESP